MNENKNDWIDDQEEHTEDYSTDKSKEFQISIDEDKLDEVLGSAEEFDEAFIESADADDRRNENYRTRIPRGDRRRPEDRAPRKKRRKKKNGCLYKMIYFIVICLVSVIISQILISGINDMLAVNKDPTEATIVITEEDTIKTVADRLEETGLINEKWFYTLYAELTHATYRFGTYQLDASMDYEALNTYLSSNLKRTDIIKITFPEGFSTEQVAARLEKMEVCKADAFIEALNKADLNSEYVKAMGNASARPYRLEGYLFPDTYEFYKNEDPVTVIKKFLNEGFRVRITQEILDKAEEMEYSIDQVLTLASIIQKEVGDPEIMKRISGIFQNRLGNNAEGTHFLGSDPTFWYPYASRETTPPNLVEEFAEKGGLEYSTYRFEGLPPGPICNPGLDAIRAVLFPEKSNDLYFVSDINGKFYYATNHAKHEQNVRFAESVPKEESSEPEDDLVDELQPD